MFENSIVHVSQIKLINFKNYSNFELKFHEKLNLITGHNGAGKTNVLDAIYYLACCKSHFTPQDHLNIKRGEDFFRIEGSFTRKETIRLVATYGSGRKKQMTENDTRFDKLSAHIGRYPVVMIAPGDVEVIHGGSEKRRKLLDGAIAQMDRKYLQALLSYQKVLRHRSALLKSFWEKKYFDRSLLKALDEQLIEHGTSIFEQRKRAIEPLQERFQYYYGRIAEKDEEVGFRLRSELEERDFRTILETSLQKDRIVQRTTSGIHRDDLIFELNTYSVKKSASQGQQKSYLIALKLAIYAFLQQTKNVSPILLLDDIFDKLDIVRLTRLVDLVLTENFGQVIITDTEKDRIEKVLKERGIAFHSAIIEKGKLAEYEKHEGHIA